MSRDEPFTLLRHCVQVQSQSTTTDQKAAKVECCGGPLLWRTSKIYIVLIVQEEETAESSPVSVWPLHLGVVGSVDVKPKNILSHYYGK